MVRIIKNENDKGTHYGDRLLCANCFALVSEYEIAHQNDAENEYEELRNSMSDCCNAKIIVETEASRE